MPAEDVWNSGPKRAWLLASEFTIHTALHLKHAPERWIKQRLSVVGLRTVLEERGMPSLPLDQAAPAQQQIAGAHASGEAVVDLASLREAVARYMVRAAERLHRQHAKVSQVTVSLQTNPFRADQPQ
jgi:DNA polymerase V